jgi:hypothetical protein
MLHRACLCSETQLWYILVRKCSVADVDSDSNWTRIQSCSGSGSRKAKKGFKKEKILKIRGKNVISGWAGLYSELVVIKVGRKRNIAIAIYPQQCTKKNVGYGFKSAGDI